MNLADVTPKIARHVLYVFDYSGGYSGGRFADSLTAAIVHADEENRALLSMGFAGYVRAVRALQSSPTGLTAVRHIAAGRS